MTSKYELKTDDLLLRLLDSYHDIDVSEAMSFFGERAKEMLESEPNITENSRSPRTMFIGNKHQKTITFTHRHKRGQKQPNIKLRKMDIGDNKVYVLRGFYPDTHLPFKMTLVKLAGINVARGKVMIGLKQHHTLIREEDINDYNNAISEAILLGGNTKDNEKVKYEYRKFQCMRPRGMELYHEVKKGKKC